MADQVLDKFNVKSIPFSKNTYSVKEEGDFVDDNVHVSQTTITIDSFATEDHTGQYNMNKIKQDEVFTTLDNIKTELSSLETQYNVINENVKIEGITADEMKTEFDSGLLYCEPCHAHYDDYCMECGMLVYILNRNVLNNAEDRALQELPNNLLEIQHSFEQFGIFALKVIPEGVKLGPFTGLRRTECIWKIEGGKFVTTEDQSKHLNWMQYINPASNASEHNLHVFECEDNLYYRSTRKIQGGDELLVYFGKAYEDSLNKNVREDFFPNKEHIEKDVFACTFCCLGFSSKLYLTKHKTICPENAGSGFSIEELTQCSFCKVFMDQREYFKHHMAYCSERNVRECIPSSTTSDRTSEIKRRKPRSRHVYKCEQCKYNTKYKGEIKKHTNQHYDVKTCKCRVCHRRFKTKESMRLHLENAHVFVDVKQDPDHSVGDHVIAHIKVEQPPSQDERNPFKCSLCGVRTKCKYHKRNLIIEANHSNEFDYKCDLCGYKTNRKWNLEGHTKRKHLKVFNYKCEQCNYKTNKKLKLKIHSKSRHPNEYDYRKYLTEFNYKCDVCDYKAARKWQLDIHIKGKHSEEFDYKCNICDYETNYRSHLEKHEQTKHLKEFSYKCERCEYRTNGKYNFEQHTKTVHLKEFDYSCDACDYKTNYKWALEKHIKTKHLKEFGYKCDSCEFRTNRKYNLERHLKTVHLKELDCRCDTYL